MRPRLHLAIAPAVAALSLLLATPAHASVGVTVPLTTPSAGLRELGGAALSSDGTGGVVYRAIDPSDGRAHIYVARFAYGSWAVPQRVDVGQQFDSQWARIAAASRGRLVVTWTQPTYFGHERLYSATVGRGARRFSAPTLVDGDVASATGNTYPSLAMNSAGEGLLVYKVASPPSNSGAVPPGYVQTDIRVARFDGQRWSVFGQRVNRNASIPMRTPAPNNAPRIAIDETGDGMVVWQEPDDRFINRVWARRIFGTRLGNQLLASPQTFGGAPLTGEADAPDVAVTRDSGAIVAFRQAPGERSRLPGTRILSNRIGDAFDPAGGAFAGAVPVDAPASGALGAPSVAIGYDGDGTLAYGQGTTALAANSDVDGVVGPIAGLGGMGTAPAPLASLGRNGYGSIAWREPFRAVVQERRDGRGSALGSVGIPGGGAIADIAQGGNALGDALVAVRQTSPGGDRISAALVDSPPQSFGLELSDRWQRTSKVRVRWQRPQDAFFVRRYTVFVDGRAVRTTGASLATLTSRQLRDGPRRRIRIGATDRSGQTVYTSIDSLRVDRRAPSVRIQRLRGGQIRVTIIDATSKPKRRGSRVEWGDSKVSRIGGSESHAYSGKRRRVRILVIAVDGAGNRRTVRRTLTVKASRPLRSKRKTTEIG